MAILPHYFKEKISLANGIMNFIAALIVVLFPILTDGIVKDGGLIGAFYFLSTLSFTTIIMSLAYIPVLPEDKSQSLEDRFRSSLGLEVFSKKKYVVWCVASFIGMFGYFIPVVTIVR